ncbi:efflux RND transporter permease subunit [Rhodohalobacter sulfatireducens]|uniref:Efflux RND transporter permease subunit n=1 Tax=Rhodohalobacter sulfatireducens TaxID=2911366 RepID=A0ABS9K7Y5_9BACT|nr:efflux RND transporter permease subunit [Rhodohalobacter sulfatireducens]MCG2586960.1 efflux RND transporter permease subunit [Rhodohalobacter sulfatireducens]
MTNKIIRFFLENKLVAVLLLLVLTGWGIATAPFDWNIDSIPRDPVPVDAIPNLGENQQIVYTEWPGQSPQDVEDQITYPLTTQLLTVPGVRTVRSTSMTGLSSIYVIFEEDIEFYWSRSRILEKLNALPAGTLPGNVQPALGPDATALGQVYWYTLEGRDENGDPTGGWDPQELRSIQDFYVGYGLSGAQGVAEVSSIGGFVREYQVDVDPNKMMVYDVTLSDVFEAVRNSNVETGARTLEMNNAEYLVRGLGYIKSIDDLESAVVKVVDNTPIRIQDVAFVTMGPAQRRGALDKAGAEAVGGVVVARQNANPQQVIDNVKAKIEEISSGLPSKTLSDGTVSKVTIIPFYDRSELIGETLYTLEEALTLEILITIIVIVIMVLNLRTSILISTMLPLAVLMSFIGMKYFGVDANIVALSGIAIAIGTIVDMGVILSENMLRHMEDMDEDESLLEVIYNATVEVASAVITAVTTTIVSFLPVFTMIAAEGKLFKPLAYTKTFALIASIIIAITLIPPFAHWFFGFKVNSRKLKLGWNGLLVISGFVIVFTVSGWAGLLILGFGLINGAGFFLDENYQQRIPLLNNVLAVAVVTWLLTKYWLPFGPSVSFLGNLIFIVILIAVILVSFWLIIKYYDRLISWCLDYKKTFLALPTTFVVLGMMIWLGFASVFGFIATGFDAVGVNVRTTSLWSSATGTFPGLGEEFMPTLDEGAFLLMPTTMPHAGVEEAMDVMQKLDMSVASIPEVETVVGKMGRTNSALDPAPISMFENVILYKSEYKTDESGRRIRYRVDDNDEFVRDENGALIPDSDGEFYRQWRDEIQSPDDIWNEIVEASRIPGTTSAPKLQPIQTRLVMLQSGMRAPMGVKVKGDNLETIESFGLQLEDVLREVPGVNASSVFAERIVGKPYLEIDWNRNELARYGLSMQDVQHFVTAGIGGMPVSTSVEGRERYDIRVRFARELRGDPESISELLVPTKTGTQIPLGQLAEINYRQGPQAIKSEDTFLVGYVIFDKRDSFAEVEFVENARTVIQDRIDSGELIVPAGINFEFAGNYENQVRAEKRLSIILPIALVIIFLIMYFQFRSVATTGMIFTSIFVAWAGGFLLIWLYGQGWFLNIDLFGQNLREVFQMGTVNLSVAVWVGFIALFGIAADGGVVMATYLDQLYDRKRPSSLQELREVVVEASSQRIRPTLMTTATTILALLPVLTSTGRGSDIMVPMAIPSVGGMLLQVITLFVVPVLYFIWKEFQLKRSMK